MTVAKIHEVLRFINAIKGSFSYEIEETFSGGFCYYFAIILKERFGGEIYFNPDLVHFAILIEDQMFDVYGLMDVGPNWINWKDFQNTQDAESILHSCILKDV